MKENTKATENFIIELYYCSLGKCNSVKPQNANFIIDLINFFFTLLSLYTDENHLTIISQLYFSKDNIKETGVRKMASKLFMEERTLYSHRKKYCKIILFLIDYVKDFTK